jgi:Ser/Thr protein kinase RdoA (MazF antagonist)
VTDPAGEPRLTVRLARPGLVDHLRDERRILDELSSTIAPGPANLSGGEPIPCLTPRGITLIEDDALPERWLLAHEHLPGQPAPIAGVSDVARERLGGCLAWVHRHRREGFTIWPSLEVQHGTRTDLFHARLATLRRYRAAESLPDAAALLDRLAGMKLPASAGWHEMEFALCHGDLSIGNILWDGEAVALIDWEFARDGDGAEDIAYLAAEQDLAPDMIGEIAEAYVDAGGDPWAFARLPAWLPLVALDAALWWADYHLAQGSDPVVQPDVMDRLKRAQRFLQGGS